MPLSLLSPANNDPHPNTQRSKSTKQVVYAYCNEWQRSHKLSLMRVIKASGDLTFDQLRVCLRCKKCGSKETETLCVWEGNKLDHFVPRI